MTTTRTRPPAILPLLSLLLLTLHHPPPTTSATTTTPPATPQTATFLLFDNGSSTNGTTITLPSTSFPSTSPHPMEDFAIEMSHHIDVSKFGEEPGTVLATKAFRGDGEQITSFAQLLPSPPSSETEDHPEEDDGVLRVARMQRVYLVADGLEFIWPFVHYGYNQTVSPRALTALDPSLPVVLSSVSETPRVFVVHNLFSAEEADELVEHNKKKLQRSTTGNNVRAKDQGRTSENSWDSSSPVARGMITRTFNLTGIQEDAGKVDGLQVVRYLEKQFYNTHHDYFSQGSDENFDFMPYSGGSNRFATVFMYVDDPLEGGHTVFPQAPNPNPPLTPPSQYALDLFPTHSMEHRMVHDCHSKTSVPPLRGTAALFYSATPDGRMDSASLHGACPVIRGVKWGANIWIWNRQRFGLLKSGGKRELTIRNECGRMVFVEWEGKPSGSVGAGESMTISSFEFHRFKASFEKRGKAFTEFTVQGKGKAVLWVIKQPRVYEKKKKKREEGHRGVGKAEGTADSPVLWDSVMEVWEGKGEEEEQDEEEEEEYEEDEEEEEEEKEDDILRLWMKKKRKKRRRKRERERRAAYYESKGDDDEEL